MRIFSVTLMSLLLVGCGQSVFMVNTRGNSHSQYAPSNETSSRGGTIKYYNQGNDSIVKARREESYKQMHDFCGGPYKIVKEMSHDEGSDSIVTPGLPIVSNEPIQYWYMDFECDEKK